MVKLVTQLVIALIVVNVQIVIIAQLAIVAINALVVKLAIRNVIQIIKRNLYIALHLQLGSFHYYQ